MDYSDFVRKHRESGAAITIAALPCEERIASAFGIMKINETGEVRACGGGQPPWGDEHSSTQCRGVWIGG
jgi:ADP-glucose pyrophosphorylase